MNDCFELEQVKLSGEEYYAYSFLDGEGLLHWIVSDDERTIPVLLNDYMTTIKSELK